MYYVYILQSQKTKGIYIGYTNDLKRRFREHNQKRNEFTDAGQPWKLIYYEAYRNERDAKDREKKLKQYGNARTYIKQRLKFSML